MDKIIDNNNIDKKQIFLIAIIAILLLIIIGLLFYINLSKDTSTTITATVQNYSDGYIIVKDNDSKDKYLLEVEDEYYEDDIVKITIDNIDDSKKLKTGKITKIKLIKRNNNEEENIEVVEENTPTTDTTNQQESSNTNTETKDTPNTNSTTNNESTTNNNNKTYTEDDVITYFNDTKNETDASPTITSRIKTGFVSIVDFLFYGGTIKGYTFNQLSTSAKIKVLRAALAIDSKIDSKFPDYKKTLSEKYQNVKSKIVSTYLNITEDVCSKNEDTCKSAKDGLTDMKTNFKITWSFIKDISGIGLSKLKSWYAIWKEA